MSTKSDDLADALFEQHPEWKIRIADGSRLFHIDELRTLAREAEAMGAKRALEEAAREMYRPVPGWEAGAGLGPSAWLRARAEQIGKDSE